MKGANRQQTEGLNQITGEQWISDVPGAMVVQGTEETRILNILKIKKKKSPSKVWKKISGFLHPN